MQHRPILRDVDLVTAEPRIHLLSQTRLLGQLDQELQRAVVCAVLRIVEKDPARLCGIALAASWILCKQLTQMSIANLLEMGLKGLPRCAFAERYELCCRLHTLFFSFVDTRYLVHHSLHPPRITAAFF